MASFMRDHADDLASRLRTEEQARVHEQVLPAGDEGVYLPVAYNVDVHILAAEPRRLEYWRRVRANGIFRLGVSDQGDPLRCRRKRIRENGGHNQRERGRPPPENAHHLARFLITGRFSPPIMAEMCRGAPRRHCRRLRGSNQPGVIEPVEGFFGGISADEPRAAIAGRDVLIAGGSAVDAVVAMGFTLAVTLPSSAGLGGGGACVTFDGRTVTPTHFDFPATTAGGSRIAIPALVRGLALVHARYGRIAWSQLLGPAESAARFGTPVSRALAHDLALAPAELTRDSATARIFAPNGTLIREETCWFSSISPRSWASCASEVRASSISARCRE